MSGCSKKCCCEGWDPKCARCCGCCWFWQARLIWFPFIILGFGLMAIILYYAGYVENNKWNNNAIETQCTVLNHSVYDTYWYCTTRECYNVYTVDCNCVSDCSSGTCGTLCQRCRIPYSDGAVTVKYLENYVKNVVVINSQDDYESHTASEVTAYLNKYYPINSNVPCYYQNGDPNNFKLFKDPVMGYYGTALFFTVLLCLTILLWIILDSVRGIKKCRKPKPTDSIEMKEVKS